jgi:hypothetical protein
MARRLCDANAVGCVRSLSTGYPSAAAALASGACQSIKDSARWCPPSLGAVSPHPMLMDGRRFWRVSRWKVAQGVRQPNATALSRWSLGVSASIASRTTTSSLSVASRPAAYVAGVPAIVPGRASEALRQRAILHPRWHVAQSRQVRRPQRHRLVCRG